MTFIETGAYNKLCHEIHMSPEESMQAHLDLKGRVMVPVHNGTFDLALHDWNEPFERIGKIARDKGVALATPIFGEPLNIQTPEETSYWWQVLEPLTSGS